LRLLLRLFLKDRVILLGVPLLVFMFELSPLTIYIGVPHIQGNTTPLTWQDHPQFIGPGPPGIGPNTTYGI
jgi:hypothetical protein